MVIITAAWTVHWIFFTVFLMNENSSCEFCEWNAKLLLKDVCTGSDMWPVIQSRSIYNSWVQRCRPTHGTQGQKDRQPSELTCCCRDKVMEPSTWTSCPRLPGRSTIVHYTNKQTTTNHCLPTCLTNHKKINKTKTNSWQEFKMEKQF